MEEKWLVAICLVLVLPIVFLFGCTKTATPEAILQSQQGGSE